MRRLYGAVGCLAWVIMVYAALGDEFSAIQSSFYLAVMGVLVLPPTAAVIAIFGGAGFGAVEADSCDLRGIDRPCCGGSAVYRVLARARPAHLQTVRSR